MEEENKSQFWLKLVLLLGFLLQFVLAFYIFTALKAFPPLTLLNSPLNTLLSLLLSLMLATPLGFLAANFIFHHLPYVRQEFKKIGGYKTTQKTLLKLLFVSLILAVLLVTAVVYLL